MRVTVIKLSIVLIVLAGLTSAETSFEEYCPFDYKEDDCEYVGFDYSSPINCTEGKTCVTNGCSKECREPVLDADYTDGCYYNYTSEEICPENQFCCFEECYQCFELPPPEIGDSTTYDVTDLGCCYSLWEIFPYSESCEPGKKCLIDGCLTECKEATFSDGYCSESYTSEEDCAEDEICCFEDCTYTCKKEIILEEGETTDITDGGCCFSGLLYQDYEADCSEGKTCTLNGCQKECKEPVVDTEVFTYDVTGEGCCYSGLLWELTSSSYYSEVDCEREKICVINGCRRECRESYDYDYYYDYLPFLDSYGGGECFSSYFYEDLCEKNEFCCYEDCTYVCKPKITLEAGSTTDITDDPCCYSSLIYEYSSVNCSEGKTCVMNGCEKICREPVPNKNGGCYYNFTYEETCQEGQFCCSEDCSSTCEDLPKDLGDSTYDVTDEGCCYSGILWELTPDPIDCSKDITCVTNGCVTECREIIFYKKSCTDPTNPLCKCYYSYSSIEECPKKEFCCWDESCTPHCKPEIVLKANTTTDISDLGCCYSGLIYDVDYDEEIDCSEGETCVINGCQKQCREPVFYDDIYYDGIDIDYEDGCYYTYTYEDTCTDNQFCCWEDCTSKCIDIPTDPIIEEECYYNFTSEDTCPEDKICCYEEECSFVCKDSLYRNEGCPNLSSYKPNWWEYSYYDYVTLCDEDHECDEWELCCPTNCSLFENICSYPVNRKVTCPDLKISGETTDPGLTPCESNSTCIEMDLLCCRLYSDKEDTYCTEPIYVDDPYPIIIF